MNDPYVYWATVERIHDGDTLTLNVDLGFRTWLKQSFRLLGCNARELHDPGGTEARDHLATLLPPGVRVQLTSTKPDKYGGRYLARIDLAGDDLVTYLITHEWAAPWDGIGAKPLPPWPRTTNGL